MAPSILLVHRHQWSGGPCTRIEPQPVEHWELSWPELAGLCGCPVEALRFSRLGPVHLAHGGSWARLEALDSLRWPFLDASVIHGRAVAVRPVLGSDSANCPGQDQGQLFAVHHPLELLAQLLRSNRPVARPAQQRHHLPFLAEALPVRRHLMQHRTGLLQLLLEALCGVQGKAANVFQGRRPVLGQQGELVLGHLPLSSG